MKGVKSGKGKEKEEILSFFIFFHYFILCSGTHVMSTLAKSPNLKTEILVEVNRILLNPRVQDIKCLFVRAAIITSKYINFVK